MPTTIKTSSVIKRWRATARQLQMACEHSKGDMAISATPGGCLWRHTPFSIPGQHAEHVVLRRKEHNIFVFALHNPKRKISIVKMAGNAV
jgi:hypothetical protein